MTTDYLLYAGSGDAWADKSGNFNNTGNSVWIGGTSDIDKDPKTWFPFASVPISQGVQIEEALVTFETAITRSDTVEVKIGCEDADNPSDPTNASDLNGRTLTSAYLSVSLQPWILGNDYTYDITSAVQEVLDRPGWALGNTLAVLIHDNGTANDYRRAAKTQESGYPALLTIKLPDEDGSMIFF